MIGVLGFTTPWLLLALAVLPILWVILRAVPPAPIRQRFPGIALLLGLNDDESVTARTPWWLLLLRLLALAAVILGLAGPVLNPDRAETGGKDQPLLIVFDGSWASARDWSRRETFLREQLETAGRGSRRVALMQLTAPEPVQFQTADSWKSRIAGYVPHPWEATPSQADIAEALGDAEFDTIWLTDGRDREGLAALVELFQERGDLAVYETGSPLIVLDPARVEDGIIKLSVRRMQGGPSAQITINGIGPDPAGINRALSAQKIDFVAGEMVAEAEVALPSELRARIARFEISGQGHAGAVSLSADSLQRREVALIAARDDREGLELLSPLHYLERALSPTADLLHGALTDLLPANPDVIVLADVAQLAGTEEAEVIEWVSQGGVLLRFAGPRLAASDLSRREEDPLMPVRLRAGGRTVGGAMSWGEARRLAAFDQDSPFFGLSIPEEVTINAQVLAQPGPELGERVIARLEDGTPLVTRKTMGNGQVILFHVTANAEWSNLPLSGLFVQMLERLSVVPAQETIAPEELDGTMWQPIGVIDAFGTLQSADNLGGVDGPDLITAPLGPQLQPGVYRYEDRQIARNVVTEETALEPAKWPSGLRVMSLTKETETPLGGWLLLLALLLLCLDIPATLGLSGRLWPARVGMLVLALTLSSVPHARAEEAKVQRAGLDLVLAHVATGNPEVDSTAHDGLRGLTQLLFARTSVEPGEPEIIDLETDEFAVYPFLYWPVTADQKLPSAEAYARLNTYLRTGGMIVFDTRDADVAGAGANTGAAARLKRLAEPLDIPPLEPIPPDHVITRTFYLLQDFPGRYAQSPVWVEAAPPDAEQIEGMPFRNLNDGVSPVIIGGNDWAAAWAIDQNGAPRFRVGRGYAGEQQREMAARFGVNLVLYVLTGNYKSDQVHVPALLDRLGQ